MRTISKKQFNDLQEYLEYDGVDTVFLTKLHRLTGITARPYTNYNLYDKSGDYLTDSSDLDLYDLLMQAGVDIRKE